PVTLVRNIQPAKKCAGIRETILHIPINPVPLGSRQNFDFSSSSETAILGRCCYCCVTFSKPRDTATTINSGNSRIAATPRDTARTCIERVQNPHEFPVEPSLHLNGSGIQR